MAENFLVFSSLSVSVVTRCSHFDFVKLTQYKILKMLKKYVDFIQNIDYNKDAKREKAPDAESASYLRGTLKK